MNNAVPPSSGSSRGKKVSRAASYYDNDIDNQINFVALFNVIRRGKWVIALIFSLCTLAAIVYTMTAEPEYEAQSILFISNQKETRLESLTLGDQGPGLWNEIELLKQSVPLAERVAQRLIETAIGPETQTPLPILSNSDGLPLSREVIGRVLLGSRLTFAPTTDKASMVRIAATSPSPEEAMLIANIYAEEFEHRSQESSRASFTATREFLKEQEAKYRETLGSAESNLEDFMRREGIVSLDTEGSLLVRRGADLDVQVEETRVDLGLANASLSAMVEELERIEPGLAERIASGVELEIADLQKRIATLESEANAFYANDPTLRGQESKVPELAEKVRKIQEFRGQLNKISQEYVSEVMSIGVADASVGGRGISYVAELKRQIVEENIKIQGLTAKLNVLQERVWDINRRLGDLPRKSTQFAQLEREKQSVEQLYLLLGEKAQEARVAEESELGYVEIVRPASIPKTPKWPNKELSIILGMFAGLALGLGFVFLRQALDHRLFSPDDIARHGLSLLGAVPRFDQIIKADFKNKEHVRVKGRVINTALISLLNPLSPISECYRGLHTSIQFSLPDRLIETLMVTSSVPQEGKTVTSSNLAVAIARSGRRTLYVDADLRRPRAHQMLGIDRDPGLSDILRGEATINSEALYTGIENLYMLPAGKGVPNPAELLGSKRMRVLLDHMKKHFDIIVIDTPPVLLATDAVLLSTQCDATVLVTAAGTTTHVMLARTKEQLENVGAALIGVVLNQFEQKGVSGIGYDYGYGYGEDYHYGYRYGAPSAKEPASKWTEKLELGKTLFSETKRTTQQLFEDMKSRLPKK